MLQVISLGLLQKVVVTITTNKTVIRTNNDININCNENKSNDNIAHIQ